MTRLILATVAALILATATPTDANAGRGHGRFIGGLVAGALLGGLVSREARAYRYADGQYDWRYRTDPRTDYGYSTPRYRYDYAPRYDWGNQRATDWNGRNGFYDYRNTEPVPVTPSHCQRPIYDSQSRAWRCPPVLVPRY